MVWTGSTLCVAALVVALFPTGIIEMEPVAFAQAPAASPATRQIGTVKALSGNTLTLAADGGAQVSVTVADGAKILQLAPGSTDLKAAQQITLGDITVGDRVLVTGKGADDGSFAAARVILMKSADIAQKNEQEKADWQRRGSGGLVSAVSGSTITVTSGSKKISVETSGTTKFRRYAADSVKFEDAKPGTLAQIQAGDQLRVRGDKSDDGTTIHAEEIVSGSFKNLSGILATVNASGTLTLKDLATKKMVTVNVTSNSDLRKLPPELAARFAARERGGAAAGANAAGGAKPQDGGAAAPGGVASAGSSAGRGPGSSAGPGGPGGAGRGGDLSQMLSRLPTETVGDLKVGEAVMVVASDSGGSALTAVTMLSGVEPILAAAPSGAPAMTLSPWNMGGGGGADAGGPQ